MNETVMTVEKNDGICEITLNRPGVMNSLNFALLNALKGAVEDVRYRSDVRVVIITGAGEKAFCAGADLKERATLPPEKVKEYIFTIRDLFSSVENLNKPVIFLSAVSILTPNSCRFKSVDKKIFRLVF